MSRPYNVAATIMLTCSLGDGLNGRMLSALGLGPEP